MTEANKTLWLSVATGHGRLSVALSADKDAARRAFDTRSPQQKAETFKAIPIEGKALFLVKWLKPKSRDELLSLIHTVLTTVLYG